MDVNGFNLRCYVGAYPCVLASELCIKKVSTPEADWRGLRASFWGAANNDRFLMLEGSLQGHGQKAAAPASATA